MEKESKLAIQPDICFKINKKLPIKLYVAYGLGHILNDVCAALWFSYLLVFFHYVLGFENGQAGILLLVGQVADAIATPFVGYNSDKSRDWWIYRFGKRKVWYLMGTICVIFTFPFIFSPCINCSSSSALFQMFYYSFFITLFQFGWAAVQIAHMSLIPEITSNKHERTRLAAVRNGATVMASVLVYLVTWGILHISGSSKDKLGPDHAVKFQYIVWSVMSFGMVCSIIFYLMVEEPSTTTNGNEQDSSPALSFKKLFCNPNLYFVGTVYMSSRLFINLTQVFISLYLSESLNMVASALALVPLAIYIASFVASFPVGSITKKVGRKATFTIGAAVGIAGCIWIHWGEGETYTTYLIFLVSSLLGAASTVVLVSSLDITTELIGSKTSRGAFIYGIMSFADKLSNGVAVEVIQGVHKDGNIAFYRDVLTYVCGGALVLGVAAVMMIRNNKENQEKNNSMESLAEDSISTITEISITTIENAHTLLNCSTVKRRIVLSTPMRVLSKIKSETSINIEESNVNHLNMYRRSPNFHENIRFALVLSQCFGVMPLHDVGKRIEDVNFKFMSLKLLYSLIHFGCVLATGIAAILKLALHGFVIDETSITSFYIFNSFASIYFIYLAYKWGKILKEYSYVEFSMRNYSCNKNIRRLNIWTSTFFMFFGLSECCCRIICVIFNGFLVEHILFVLTNVDHTLRCEKHRQFPVEIYFGCAFPQWFTLVRYSHWAGALVEFTNFISTFTWNFTDLFIVLISISLREKFNQISNKIKQSKNPPVKFWKEIREDYFRVSNLTKLVDIQIAGLVLISFLNNILFLCIQLYNSIKERDSILDSIYFFYSFGYIVFRLVAVSLYSATLNEAARKPLKYLYSIPSDDYTIDVSRLITQINYLPNGITGHGFFLITKNFLLQARSFVKFCKFIVIVDVLGGSYSCNVRIDDFSVFPCETKQYKHICYKLNQSL
ncbi:uncharacterized protein [Euwallacea fornicatus]|uniref:uncharacterized protein n=1 Tax=Euwallacea fornicatus TaxID=995702 RepID=UPI00338EB186